MLSSEGSPDDGRGFQDRLALVSFDGCATVVLKALDNMVKKTPLMSLDDGT
jgi:hypothetical protein